MTVGRTQNRVKSVAVSRRCTKLEGEVGGAPRDREVFLLVVNEPLLERAALLMTMSRGFPSASAGIAMTIFSWYGPWEWPAWPAFAVIAWYAVVMWAVVQLVAAGDFGPLTCMLGFTFYAASRSR